ncbi:MAG: 3-phosphoglycerate dehydrogenase [Deltaproteobacteria bacterium]|nr:3-phosphoglycerate dehydrogenase [Deltaproteobacteria bacterium]
MRILISDKAHQSCAQKFKEAGFEVDEKPGLSPDELKAIIKNYEGLVIRSATKVTADLLEAAQNLKVVGRAGTGLDNVDIPAAATRNVVVMNTPGQNSNAAAELAMAMIFALARHLPRACASLKACNWEKKALQGREIMGKTLGVVGFGNIGCIVGELGRGVKMTVLAHDPYLSDGQIREAGGEPVSFDELLARSDFITIHIPRTKETTGLFNSETIAKMKDGAYLINCARGGIVNEDALYKALKSGKLAGGALDVFEVEPPGEHKLLELDSFICTPHLGASTLEAQINVAVAVADQMIRYLKDGETVNAVNV